MGSNPEVTDLYINGVASSGRGIDHHPMRLPVAKGAGWQYKTAWRQKDKLMTGAIKR
jgi:hypothetical protein